MRFRGSGKAQFLNRRDQFRMIALIAALGAVLLAMRAAANPETWRRLLLLDGPSAPETAEDFAAQRAENSSRTPGGLPPDEFRTDEAASAARVPHGPKPSSGPLAIDPEALAAVRDDTLGIHRDERKAYFELLARLRDAEPADIRRAARDGVSYAAISRSPGDFRGQAIAIEGRMKRLLAFDPGENEHGFERLYEAWVFTDDSGLDPYRVVSAEIPAGMPQGDLDPLVPVRVAGCFFKMERYAAQHGKTHPAPLLLAQRIERVRPTAVEEGHGALSKYVLGFVLAVAAALGFTLWRVSQGDKKFYHGHLKRIVQAPQEHIDALAGIETIDTRRMLAELAAAEAARDVHDPPVGGGTSSRIHHDR